MHHKLDIHPVPEEVLYINELSLAENVPYETKDTMEKAVTGKCVRDSGILPDDNVRIYVPISCLMTIPPVVEHITMSPSAGFSV